MAEQSPQQSQPAAAKAPDTKIVLLFDLHEPSGKLLPAGTVLDRNTPWVAQCVVPYDMWESQTVHDLKARTAVAVAEAEKVAAEAIEKAKKEAQ